MDFDAFERLLNRYFDEGLDEQMTRELEEMLLSSPEARAEFWRQSKTHTMLRQIGQESWGANALPEDRQANAPSAIARTVTDGAWLRTAALTGILATIFICIAAILVHQRDAPERHVAQNSTDTDSDTDADSIVSSAMGPKETGPKANKSPDATSVINPIHRVKLKSPQWVAVVRREVDVVWEHPRDAMIAGEIMSPRRIKFRSGLMELQTDRGVLITIEGPADLKVVNGMEVVCRRGRLRVDVPPPAIGFVVSTSQFDVVDLGTSFAMEIGGDKQSEVHVIKGLVQIVPDSKGGKANRELREGEAIGVAGGVYKDIASDADAFPSSEKLENIIRKSDKRQRDSWALKQKALAKDPDCLIYYDFQDVGKTSTLNNRAINAAPDSQGTIVGAQWAQGRWPKKRGLEFRRLFDRVLFSVPGQYQSLTCLASVRLDSLDTRDVALLVPSASSQGNFRWVFSPSASKAGAGNPRIDYKQNGTWSLVGRERKRSFLRQERLGTWVRVAFVWDSEKRVIDQYINGVRLPRHDIPEEVLSDLAGLQLGEMEMGGQTQSFANSRSSLENFTGCIDEFAIIGRALSLQELRVYHIADRTSWSHASDDNRWNNSENWHGNIEPGLADTVFIDLAGDDAANFAGGSMRDLTSLRIGTDVGLKGELKITGGVFEAYRNSQYSSRVGVNGGDGRVLQQAGEVKINSLQIGLDKGSRGSYRLESGNLSIVRKNSNTAGSIDIGPGGFGKFEIAGGTLQTRRGIILGTKSGVGEFRVEGSNAKRIAVGSYKDGDGFWQQQTGSTLSVQIDADGLTPIFVDNADGHQGATSYEHGNVLFAEGSLLDVSFDGEPRSGSWDVMRWEGVLSDKGLEFSRDVDPKVWSFQFVDTDKSGSPDTLRVTAAVAE